MDMRPIQTDEDHRAALAEIDASWGAPEGTEEGDKLEVLVALVELYEAKVGPSKPIRVLTRSRCYAMPSRSLGTPKENWLNSWAHALVHRKFSPAGVR